MAPVVSYSCLECLKRIAAMTVVAGTSWAERQALRALAHACDRAGGPVPLRKVLLRHTGKLGKLIDLGLVGHRQDGETRVYRSMAGSTHEYVETIYEPTATGYELIERTAGEPPPPPTPLRDEHWAILAVLGASRSARSAASMVARCEGLTVQQVGQRLSLLARHGYATDIAGDYMAPTRWIITDAGRVVLVRRGTP